ncbi:MAG: DUF4380 domain-containing protein [Paludibacteraceae bacterium]|nr:DUF4380 domain-containing protein [Paludibacteraceae bacterium]
MSGRIVKLESAGVVALINVNVGGRLVFFGRKGGENMIKSDKFLLEETVESEIIPDAFTDFVQYYGQEVWVGPQTQWWKHQTINMERRNSPINWPPDPYVSFGKFEVVEKTDSQLVIQGCVSEVSKLSLRKIFSLNDKGLLRCHVEATYHGDGETTIDLWNIVRVSGENKIRICGDLKEIDGPTHPFEKKAIGKKDGDFYTFCPDEMTKDSLPPEIGWGEDGQVHSGKFHMDMKYGIIESYNERLGDVLVMSFPICDLADDGNTCVGIHPTEGHSLGEVYCYHTLDEDKSMYELECHGKAETLKNGDTASTCMALFFKHCSSIFEN